MVLDQAIAASGEDFPTEDVSPTSDTDVYSNDGSTTPQEIQIDYDSLPHPMPIFGRLFGFTDARSMKRIVAHLTKLDQVVGRPLTDAETSCISYNVAKAYRTESYGRPLGLVAGLARAYQMRETFKFPFARAKLVDFNPNRCGPLTGNSARIAWHSLRALTYGSVGLFFGSALFASYAGTVSAVNQHGDSRMRDVVAALRDRAGRTRANNTEGRRWADQTNTNRSSGSDAADEIPYGTETGTPSDQKMRSQESMQQPHRTNFPTEARKSTFAMKQVTSQPQVFDDDNASPTAGNDAYESSSEGGSAWDRLRQAGGIPASSTHATPASQQHSAGKIPWADVRRGASAQQHQADGSTVGDSYSFSEGDEQAQLAKVEAQNEFDGRVDRERRGQDFQDSNYKWP